jgi:hypothetical protein
MTGGLNPPDAALTILGLRGIGLPARMPPSSRTTSAATRLRSATGEVFLSRWGDKTAAQLIARFDVTARDSSFGFKNVDDNTAVNIVAYVLQMNGATPGGQTLTRATNVVVSSVVK